MSLSVLYCYLSVVVMYFHRDINSHSVITGRNVGVLKIDIESVLE